MAILISAAVTVKKKKKKSTIKKLPTYYNYRGLLLIRKKNQ